MKTPADRLAAVASELGRIAAELRDSEQGEQIFTRADVELNVEKRLHRERGKQRRLQAELAEVTAARDAAVAELEGLRGRLDGADLLSDVLQNEDESAEDGA